MTYPNNSPRRNDGYGPNGMGSGTWIAIAVAIAVIVVGAIYWASGNDTSTANNDHATPVTTTGSAPTSPAPTSAPAAPTPAPANK